MAGLAGLIDRNATVGGIREARTAGSSPASAPIRMAEAMPPDRPQQKEKPQVESRWNATYKFPATWLSVIVSVG